MNKTKTIYFLSAIVCIIGCYALNLSYSLFVQTESKEAINSSVPALAYTLTINDTETNTVTIPAGTGELVSLKITNTGNSNMKYGISIPTLPEGITARLVEKEGNNVTGTLNTSSITEFLVYLTNATETDATITFTITPKYETLNFDETSFIASANIDTVNTVKFLNDAIITRATSTEITDENKTVYSTTLLTQPAAEPNGENERLLLATDDDYTATTGKKSYYFRGNVQDNYVNFAGMCWKIVRIQGNESIKLILEDENAVCNSDSYTGDWNVKSVNYGYDGGYEPYNSSYYNKFIAKYLDPKINVGESMVYVAHLFQTNSKITSHLNKLQSGGWCFNNNAYSSLNAVVGVDTPLTVSEIETTQLNRGTLYYDSYVRLYGSTKTATLKCNGEKYNNFKTVNINDTIYVNESPMYVATLTADEIAFAGSNLSDTNINMYLINSEFIKEKTGLIVSKYMWTLSLGNYAAGQYDTALVLSGSAGALYNLTVPGDYLYSTYFPIAFRPSIVLKNNSIIISGNGTQANPYVIG